MVQRLSGRILPVSQVGIKYVVVGIIAVVTLFPFYWALITSFKPVGEVVTMPPIFFPRNPVGLSNYQEVLRTVPLDAYYRNSLVVAVVVTLSKLFTSSLAGYIFAKFEFFGQRVLFILVLATMMIPFQVITIPVFVIFNQLRLIDSLWALVIPSIVSPFGIFLMRQFMKALPSELLDAARIDGSSEFGTYWRVVLPQCKPALSALAIFAFMHSWDDFFWPLLVLRSPAKFTVPMGVHMFGSWLGLSYYDHLLMAITMMAIVPVVLVFIVAQRQFIEGITLTGLKG